VKALYDLPFEVHFDQLYFECFEVVNVTGWSAGEHELLCEHTQGKSAGISFICEHPSKKRLIAVMEGRLEGVLPPWLDFIEDEAHDVQWSEYCRLIRNGAEIAVVSIDDELDDLSYDMGYMLYNAEGFTPSIIVLDAYGKRIAINNSGQVINSDSDEPVVSFTDEEIDGCTEGAIEFDQALLEIFSSRERMAAESAAKKPAAKKPAGRER
jgi:hypothetical protein